MIIYDSNNKIKLKVLIGLDRLRAIRWPIIQRSWLKPIIVIWILSTVLASPQVLNTARCLFYSDLF
jgi:hypothetical protein